MPSRTPDLETALARARARLIEIQYDCLGCEVCYPALALNALGVEGESGGASAVEVRAGWPPLPGAYTVLRYHAPVAICTLTDESLAKAVAAAAGPEIAMVGTLQTENLGIERLIVNTLANPNLRFLIVCGLDSRQAVGHLPGQSLPALARAGLDERMRIIGAKGQRPVLRNLSREAVEHFRRTVEVVGAIGQREISCIMESARACARRDPGPAERFDAARTVPTVRGRAAARFQPDPAGYFVVFPDCARQRLLLEHYSNDGLLDLVIEGTEAAEFYLAAIERGLVTRLDHAAYLGRELARAEDALRNGEPYVQDAAPETAISNATLLRLSPMPLPLNLHRRARLPTAAVAAALVLHDLQDGGSLGGFWVQMSQAVGEACAPPLWWAGDVVNRDYRLGYSYALPPAVALVALRRYREPRFCAAGKHASGGLCLSGVLVVAGLLPRRLLRFAPARWCGEWLGAAFLPVAKPLIAILTTLSVAAGWWWPRRHSRSAGAGTVADVSPSRGSLPMDVSLHEALWTRVAQACHLRVDATSTPVVGGVRRTILPSIGRQRCLRDT